VVFGRRDVSTVVNTFSTDYNFNSNMALTFRMRHSWSKVRDSQYHSLLEDGGLGELDYSGLHDTNFNAFNIDMVYRWRFAPGSDLFVVWKNSLLNSTQRSDLDYFRNLDNLFDNPQRNSISMKLIYFPDYANIRGNKQQRG
jgi:hypothetical protein